MDTLITLKDGMARLKISDSTIRRLVKDGTFTKYKVGGQVRLDWDQVKSAIREKGVDSTSRNLIASTCAPNIV